MAFSNVYAHMGSKLHFQNFYEAVHGRSSTEEEWLQYTAGNAYGPMRALRTKQQRNTPKTASATITSAQMMKPVTGTPG